MTNPNGANQYKDDPRKKLCWELYIDPNSETFGNALQSAIRARYEPDYADQITTTNWFKEKVRRFNMLGKAERNLEKALDTNYEKDGEIKSDIMRIVIDVSKTIVTTLGKNEGYSERREVTGANGGELTVQVINYADTNTPQIQPEELPDTNPSSI